MKLRIDLLEVSLENWFFECYFYEIEIYSWWWVHDFENLINDFDEKRWDLDWNSWWFELDLAMT